MPYLNDEAARKIEQALSDYEISGVLETYLNSRGFATDRVMDGKSGNCLLKLYQEGYKLKSFIGVIDKDIVVIIHDREKTRLDSLVSVVTEFAEANGLTVMS